MFSLAKFVTRAMIAAPVMGPASRQRLVLRRSLATDISLYVGREVLATLRMKDGHTEERVNCFVGDYVQDTGHVMIAFPGGDRTFPFSEASVLQLEEVPSAASAKLPQRRGPEPRPDRVPSPMLLAHRNQNVVLNYQKDDGTVRKEIHGRIVGYVQLLDQVIFLYPGSKKLYTLNAGGIFSLKAASTEKEG